MTQGEFLDRLDQHLAASRELNEHNVELLAENRKALADNRAALGESQTAIAETRTALEENREAFERNVTELDRFTAEFEASREDRRDLRQFLRDLTRRNEIVLGRLATESAAGREVLIDLHEESQAQRGAILTLIDELRRNGLGR